ncbi:MAG TPA: ABC transporter substrate-binding protein [Chloroflexota bacterium]|nr:ABC transporter substrate-binding protein [Chloroflexota bacterium]
MSAALASRALRPSRFAALLVATATLVAGCGAGAGGSSAPARPAAPAAAAPASNSAVAPAPGSGSAPAAAAPAASAGSATAAAPAPLSPPEPVKVGTSVGVTAAPLFIGLERGYFRELGLDVEPIPFNSAAEMFQPIAASQLDVASVDTGAGIFNALARGLPLRFVADSGHAEAGRSTTMWMVRQDLYDNGTIRDLADLRGKRISPIAQGSTVDSQVQRTLALAGIAPDDVDLQYVTFPDVPAAFANGVLDAAVLTEPLATVSVERGIAHRWKGMDEIFGPIHGTFLTYAPAVITQRQEVGRRYLLAYLRGVRDYHDAFQNGKDFDAVVAILTQHTNIKDPAVYKKIVIPAIDPNGQMIVQSVRDLQQWFVDNGYVPTPVNVDEYFDTSFADYALSILGRR